MEPKSLWHHSVQTIIDNRRLIIRALLTVCIFGLVVYIVHLLFFSKVDNEYKDIVNVIIGALLASFSKVTDFWFKKDDEDLVK